MKYINFLAEQLKTDLEALHAPLFLTNHPEENEDKCEWCGGEGVIATDEDDGEGHTMRGVGSQKCICQVSSPEY